MSKSKEIYAKYLKSDRWKELRNEAIELAGGRCVLCNSDKNLQVHHREYPKTLGEETQSMLTALCARCHRIFHRCAGKIKQKKTKKKSNHQDKSQTKKKQKNKQVKQVAEEKVEQPKPKKPRHILRKKV